MDLACIICSDGMPPSSDVRVTSCGHIFHYDCLMKWLGQSKSCPQCRSKSHIKDLRKVYLNTANFLNEGSDDDIATLRFKFDNATIEINLLKKDIQTLREEKERHTTTVTKMREENKRLEDELRVKDSVTHALKDKIKFFKKQSKEKDVLAEEMTKLKNKILRFERTQIMLDGSAEEVGEMLKSINDVESLVTLCATLKKALVEEEQKKKRVEHKLRNHVCDTSRHQKVVQDLTAENSDLRRQVEEFKRKLISTSQNSKPHRTETETNPESTTNSPYLRVKSIDSLMSPKHKQPSFTPTNQMYQHLSIFRKTSKPNLHNLNSGETAGSVYDGLGGHSKEEVFPTPKTVPVGMKRYRNETSTSGGKQMKLSNFLN